MFSKIDTDRDGSISFKTLRVNLLSKDILNIFKPLFHELRDLNEPLDLDEFVDAGLRLYHVSYFIHFYLFRF